MPPAPDPNIYFEVHLFQLNAAVDTKGDSAIALLVQKDRTETKANYHGEVIAAVLIDTGYNTGTSRLILNTIKQIQADYEDYSTTTDPPKYFQFDAVIISHWDSDHYKGLFNFLATESIYTGDQCNHFKYDDAKDPLTRLYCQKWPPAGLYAKAILGYGFAASCILVKSDSSADNNSPFDLSVRLHPAAENRAKRITKPKTLKVYSTTDLCNGVNVFTGKSLTTKEWPDILNLTDLVTNNDPYSKAPDDSIDLPGAPGLYIVGVNNAVLGNTTELTGALRSGFREDVASEVGPRGGLKIIDLKKAKDGTNPNSIVMLVVWKNIDATLNPKVSLYTGGDSEFVMENKVGNFVAGEKIQVIKSGHHASKASTSRKFIEAVKPDHYLISAGTAHGHPVPEVLLYLDAWFSQNNAVDLNGNDILKRLHGVVFPYHLGWVEDTTVTPPKVRYFKNELTNPDLLSLNQIKLDGETDKEGQMYVDFVKWLVATYKGLNIDNPLTAFTIDVDAVIARDGAAVAAAVAAHKKNKRHKAPKELANELSEQFSFNKIKFLSPLLAKSWAKWSNTKYQYFPRRAFDADIEAGTIDAPPTDLLTLDYILATLSYDTTKNALASDISLFMDGNKVPNDPPTAKRITRRTTGVLLTKGALVSVGERDPPTDLPRKSNKRKSEQRTVLAELSFKMSVRDEEFLQKSELDGDVDMEPDEAISGDDNSNDVVFDSLKSGLLQVAVAADVPQNTVPSAIYPSDGASGANLINLDYASDSDYFVAALQSGCLLLANATLGNGAWQGTLQDQDVLAVWMSNFFVGPITFNGMSFSGTTTGPFIITGAKIQTTMRSLGGLVYTSDLQTVATAFDFNIEDPVLTEIVANEGFLKRSTGLIFGLATKQPSVNANTTIDDIFAFLESRPPHFLDPGALLTLDCTPPAKNRIWVLPDENNAVACQLSFSSDTTTAWMITAIPGLTFANCKLIATKRSYLLQHANTGAAAMDYMVSDGNICIQAQTSLQNSNLSAFQWSTIITWSSAKASLILRWNDPEHDPISDFFTWLTSPSASWKGIDIGNAWSDFSAILAPFKELHLREVKIDAVFGGGSWSFSSFAITFELDLDWGVQIDGARVPIALNFTYAAGGSPYIELSGRLWHKRLNNIKTLNPDAAPFPLLDPSWPSPQYYISLLALKGQQDMTAVPTGVLPTYITNLNVSFATDSISFSGMMVSDPTGALPKPSSWLALDKIWISATYTNNMGNLSFKFYAEIILTPRLDPPTYSATLGVDVSYDSNSKAWTIAGNVQDLNVGCLYSLFPGSNNDAIMNVMEEITIDRFDINYNYTSNGTSFNASGSLTLGDISLNLVFNRNPLGWSFIGELDVEFTSTGTTIGRLLEGVSSDFLTDIVPDFVKGIGFFVPRGSSITLTCVKANDDFMLFSVVARVGRSFEFAFAQLSSVAPPAPGEVTIPQKPKRLFKFTMETLPDVVNVPLLEQMTQPFDQMDFLWLSDDLTRQEAALLNQNVFSGRKDQLCYTDPRLQTLDPNVIDAGGNQDNDKVILKGCHFQIIVEKNNVPTPILDYTFAGQSAPQKAVDDSKTVPGTLAGPVAPVDPAQSVASNGAATAPFTKTLGPLTISAIGLKYQSGTLQFTFDATVKLGPIIGNVKGFGIRFSLNNLSRFSTDGIQVLFDGVALEMDRPPVALAGMLVQNSDGSFQGGVAIEVDPYAFVAGGYYNHVTGKNEDFKSLFVFAQMEGPIAELEFASISGLEGGLGYNSQITLPSIDNVTSFPFLAKPPSSDLLSIMNNYFSGGWFTPKNGPCWIAAGLTVKAFQTLDIQAVVVVDLSDDVVFGIYGDILADIPASATQDKDLFARIDMGFLAVLNPAKGSFRAEGQLTPKSFILDQSCHLTGGFALCYWWEGSGHEGDWVFTVGGYHSAYSPPIWYPQPRRLAISWQYDSSLSIHGQAYFAITPKVCMGGGALRINYNSGDLHAYFNAYADFLINYRPFSFFARVGVEIGVRYTMDFWITTKTFDIHLGASLDLHGPPVAGVAHIDWCIFSFDIYFGEANPPQAALLWPEFCALLRQDKGDAVDDPENTYSGKHLHTIAPTSGTISDNNNKQSQIHSLSTDILLVDASDFSFRFTTYFPITSVVYTAGDLTGDLPQATSPTYMKPMQIGEPSNVVSVLTVGIIDADGHPAKFLYKLVQKQVPTALWGPYDAGLDPSNGQTVSSLLSPGGATVLQTMGIQFVTPEPTPSLDDIQFSIDLGSAYAVGTPVLPGKESVPQTAIGTDVFDSAVNLWAPMTPDVPCPPRTVLGRITTPKIAKPDIVNAWIAWQDLTTDAPFGAALATLGATTDNAPNWVHELYTTPTAPLPVLSAEASVKALLKDGTRFASRHYRGTPPILNRDWLDGGFI